MFMLILINLSFYEFLLLQVPQKLVNPEPQSPAPIMFIQAIISL